MATRLSDPANEAVAAQLERFLRWLMVAAVAFAGAFLAAFAGFGDIQGLGVSLILAAAAATFLLARRQLRRGRTEHAVVTLVAGILGFTVLVSIVTSPYPVVPVIPLLAAVVALPYLAGRRLAALFGVAWLISALAAILMELNALPSALPAEVLSVLRTASMAVVAALLLLLMGDFSSRLRGALAEARSAGDALLESESRYRTLVERLPGVVYVAEFGVDGRWHYVSPQIESLLGFPARQWLDDPTLWERRVHPDDRIRVIADGDERGPVGGTQTWEYRVLAADDHEVWIRDEETVISRDATGRPLMTQGVMIDITDRKRLEDELAHQAFHDSLTGLPNRALFMDRLEHALARAARTGSGLAVLYLDIDDFKLINDTLGHGAGDRLLVEVGNRLRRAIRDTDTAARPGGDEFTLLLEDVDEVGGPQVVANRIAGLLDPPVEIDGRAVRVTASIGIARRDGPDPTGENLLRQADVAMYDAKAAGKARHATFDPVMFDRAWARLEFEAEIRRGIERDEFLVVFQPVVDLATGRIAEVEALLRWRHPVRGLVLPGEFIPLAEESGLIVPLGRHVLARAAAQVVAWQRDLEAARTLDLSVNLSARQFLDPDLVASVEAVLAETGLDPARLRLEITETSMIADPERTETMLRDLRRAGVRLAVDDFGTGYSALNYLKRFPVDGLKIDRSFIADLGRDPQDGAIVSAAVAFARALGLTVTGEGIETPAQASILRELGCERGQGFLFCRPLPPDELTPLLAEGRRLAPPVRPLRIA